MAPGMSLRGYPVANLPFRMEIPGCCAASAKTKSRTPENPLHTYEPTTVASFRTWRDSQDYVARDRCPTPSILSKDLCSCVLRDPPPYPAESLGEGNLQRIPSVTTFSWLAQIQSLLPCKRLLKNSVGDTMLLPIGHEKNTVTRLPIVTVLLILFNIIAFVLTTGEINNDQSKSDIATVRTHILILKARYPDLTASPDAQQMIDQFRKTKPRVWTWLSANERKPEDAWEVALLLDPEPRIDRLQSQMDDLCHQFATLETSDSSLLWKYAYHSYKTTPESYLTHQFLHGGWFHLLSNMWMLWLCGVILEDVWGHFVVLGFYLVAGVCAAFFFGWMTPNSMVPMIGASGSIAGLMGALLARFPTLKVRIAYFFFIRFRTFLAPVYLLGPLWFFAELFWGMMGAGGVAHWAHVGGFIFGVVVGLAFYAVKIESVVNRDDPDKTWTPDEQYLRAMDLLDQRNPEACITELRDYLRKNPNSLDGWQLLLKAQNCHSDSTAQCNETLPALIRLSLEEGNTANAADYLAQFRAAGGTHLPAPAWIEICRKYEKDQLWEAAAHEYDQLGRAYYTTDRVSLTALMSAARIFQSKLNRPLEAERLYQETRNSPLPHLDWDGLIAQGLRQCANGESGLARGTTGVPS
jgi:membrane associated rhomboid family serine protease